VQEEKNHDTDELAGTTTMRRGRSSGTTAELNAVVSSAIYGPGYGGKKNAQSLPSKGHSGALQSIDELCDTHAQESDAQMKKRYVAEQSKEQVAASMTAPKKQGSVSKVKNVIDTQAQNQVRPRRGRSSNTQLEIEAVAGASLVPGIGSESRNNGRFAAVRKDAVEAPVTSQQGSKKRGRQQPLKKQRNVISQASAEGKSTQKKSARISDREIVNLELVDELQADDEGIRAKRKRGNEPITTSNDAGRERKRTRKSDTDTEARVTEGHGELSPGEEHRGRRRTRWNAAGQPSSIEAPGVIQQEETPVDSHVLTVSSKFARDPGQARKKVASATSTINVKKAPVTAVKPIKSRKPDQLSKKSTMKARTNSRQQAPKETDSEPPQAQARKNTGSKRHPVDQNPHQDQDEADELPARTPYPHLESVTRNVSLQAIDENWEPLPQSCIDQISALLKEIQKPVTARIENDKKWNQASSAVNSVIQRVLRKLSKHQLPFPQATYHSREDDFDYEKVIDNNRTLQYQMTPAIHANELLEDELRKELARLASDKQNLADLEANAKKETVVRNEAARSVHSLLQVDPATVNENLKDDIGLDGKETRYSLDADVS
jgi:hypothetical protein